MKIKYLLTTLISCFFMTVISAEISNFSFSLLPENFLVDIPIQTDRIIHEINEYCLKNDIKFFHVDSMCGHPDESDNFFAYSESNNTCYDTNSVKEILSQESGDEILIFNNECRTTDCSKNTGVGKLPDKQLKDTHGTANGQSEAKGIISSYLTIIGIIAFLFKIYIL